jgi:MFS family permease
MSVPSPSTASQAAATPDHKKAFGHAYWMLNVIEMFERLAYFGIRAVVPLYIMQATEPGGLHLTAVHKGWIYAWWAVFQSFLPIATGGIADRYGYKRVLVFAISANVVGYVIMANFHSYYGFFGGILVLATGTAFFKPALQGSIAQNLTKANSSLGWGIFYWVVNVGAVAAPFVSTAILGKPHSLAGWQKLFYACAAFTCCNLLVLVTFKDVPSGASKTESPLQVLIRTFVNIFDPRLITWLLIMSCFWLMMYQLWDLHPNFITDWVDSSMIARLVKSDTWPLTLLWEHGDRGSLQVPQQILLNLNAALIVVLVVFMSWVARKMRTLSAMLVGMSVATLGVLVAGWTMNGWVFLLGVVFFSLGEMWTGPKNNEYLGLIAPPGKKGLYLGYVNIPVGIGVGIGSYFGGWLYDHYGEKATLALKELGARPALLARAAQTADWSDSLDKIPAILGIARDDAFRVAQQNLAQSAEDTAQTLRDAFRNDEGQIINLGLIFLAQQPDRRDAVRRELVRETRRPALDAPAASQGLADQLERGQTQPDTTVLARCLHLLAKPMHLKRFEVLATVRDTLNRDRPADQRLETADVIDVLWERYGDDPGVLNSLALEYLAQGTYLVRDAVQQIAAGGFEKPIAEIPTRLGIDRTKSFATLANALGVDGDTLLKALEAENVPAGTPTELLYLYLIRRDHIRFTAVGKHDWSNDLRFLDQLVSSDPAAMRAIRHKAGRDLPTAELAKQTHIIQAALNAKDWTRTPQQAAQLLRLNPYEARARVAAEINDAAQMATRLLWDKYQPNRGVWLPIVAIGIAATIALGVFGQLAKQWKDMNA